MTAGVRALSGVAASPSTIAASHPEVTTTDSNSYRTEAEIRELGLSHAEQQMDWLKCRIDYLERRSASSVGATERELEDLMRARDELAMSAARVSILSSRFEPRESENSSFDWDPWNEF